MVNLVSGTLNALAAGLPTAGSISPTHRVRPDSVTPVKVHFPSDVVISQVYRGLVEVAVSKSPNLTPTVLAVFTPLGVVVPVRELPFWTTMVESPAASGVISAGARLADWVELGWAPD